MCFVGEKTGGNKTERKLYNATSKSKITYDFFDWVKKEQKAIAEKIGEDVSISDLKIIGL